MSGRINVPSDLTSPQERVLLHVQTNPWSRQDEIAEALDMTVQGVGRVIGSFARRDDVKLVGTAASGGSPGSKTWAWLDAL